MEYWHMSERVSLNRKEFEAFLTENQALVERSQKLIGKIDSLEKLNKQLQDELQISKDKIASMEANLNTSMRQSDETLRKARDTVARLLRETERRVSK
jgi:predicted  nucleic acid-binding Zn-ribbon protein